MPERESGPQRPPDIAIGARVKAKRLRFERVPDTSVEFPGSSARESGSGSERVNLPDEVEPGVTYRDVEVRWAAGTRIEDDARGRRGRRGKRETR